MCSELTRFLLLGSRCADAGVLRIWLVVTGVLVVIGDLSTTWFGIASGRLEEMNPVARAGMGMVGVGAYAVFASVLAVALLVPALVPGAFLLRWFGRLVAFPLRLGVLVVVAAKAICTINNLVVL